MEKTRNLRKVPCNLVPIMLNKTKQPSNMTYVCRQTDRHTGVGGGFLQVAGMWNELVSFTFFNVISVF